jgi:nucleotide-binding universal stress UspA family protein
MYEHILVPVDGSPASAQGLREAIRLAQLTGGRIRLVHLVDTLSFALAQAHTGPSVDMPDTLRRGGQMVLNKAEEAVQAAGVPVESSLYERYTGRLSELVAEEASTWNADLVVLGTHGRRGLGRVLMGSGAEQIARTAPVPVLLVRARPQED